MPDVASFIPSPVVHLFLTEQGLRVKETRKANMQAWSHKGFETDSLTDETEDYKEKKLRRCFWSYKLDNAKFYFVYKFMYNVTLLFITAQIQNYHSTFLFHNCTNWSSLHLRLLSA